MLKFENGKQGLKLATIDYADFACLNQGKTLNERQTLIQSICSVGAVIPEGTKCWTAGWGFLAYGGSISDKLQEVDVDIISDGVCANISPSFEHG